MVRSRVCLMWSRLGPYHLARLRGATKVLGRERYDVVGVEVASRDEYGWQDDGGRDDCEVLTLFRGARYSEIPRFQIRTMVRTTLESLQPLAVATNGWSMPEAAEALRWARAQRGRRAIVMSETKSDDIPRSWWRESVKRWVLRRAAAGLVGGAAHADYLHSLGVPADRIFRGYDAVDNEYFAQRSREARSADRSLRERLALPERYFFACTRLLPRKNVDGLLRAYALYRQRSEERSKTPPWDLIVAGDGPEAASLKRLASDLGAPGVFWPGFLQYDRLPDFYSLASAFVHPAHQEAWGLVVNEAAASGLPLLLSRTVGARSDLLHDGVNGESFDPGNTVEISEALARMSSRHRDALGDMGERSRAIVSAYGPDRFGAGLLAAVESAPDAPST